MQLTRAVLTVALAASTAKGLPTFNPDGSANAQGRNQDGLNIAQVRIEKRNHDSMGPHERLDFHMGRVDDNALPSQAQNEMTSNSQFAGNREIWDANSLLLVGSNNIAERTGVKIDQDSARSSSASRPGSDVHAATLGKTEMSQQVNDAKSSGTNGLVINVRKLLGSLNQAQNQQPNMDQQLAQQQSQHQSQQQFQQSQQSQQQIQQQQNREGAMDNRQAKTEWNVPLPPRSHQDGHIDGNQQDSVRRETPEARIQQSRNQVARSHLKNAALLPQQQQQQQQQNEAREQGQAETNQDSQQMEQQQQSAARQAHINQASQQQQQQQQQADMMGCLRAAMGDLHK